MAVISNHRLHFISEFSDHLAVAVRASKMLVSPYSGLVRTTQQGYCTVFEVLPFKNLSVLMERGKES